MLLAGDEFGRTQRGNNNAYCQDNDVSWVDWSLVKPEAHLLEFVRALSRLRRDHPVFRRRRFFHGRQAHDGMRDIVWLTPSGAEMTDTDWHAGYSKSLAVFVNGDAITEPGHRGEKIKDDSFLLLINAHHENLMSRSRVRSSAPAGTPSSTPPTRSPGTTLSPTRCGPPAPRWPSPPDPCRSSAESTARDPAC
jgi:pullulanase/glycogen debranching enzyme